MELMDTFWQHTENWAVSQMLHKALLRIDTPMTPSEVNDVQLENNRGKKQLVQVAPLPPHTNLSNPPRLQLRQRSRI